jgi:hypothetical protein
MTDIPKFIFIVPYRDRENQKNFFLRQMKYILEDIPSTDYKIYFSEQCDNNDFNRGAMKNIGFLTMKQKYPEHYKNITFVFNDVDTMPYNKNLFNYQTSENIIKHFYGYTFALGGIVSVLGSDFEKMFGFPNLWSWGFEDNALQTRATFFGINIDRSQFYKILDKEIIQLADDVFKLVNKKEFYRYKENTNDGIHTIQSLEYNIDEENNTIKITNFDIPFKNNQNENTMFDITVSSVPFKYDKRGRFSNTSMKMKF